jgi:hypothetical protein
MSEYRNSTTKHNEPEKLAKDFDASARPIVTVDVERYQSFLDNSGWSEERKQEFIEALWSIVVDIVAFGFSVHPLQEVCGKDSGKYSLLSSESFNLVSSNQSENLEKPIKTSLLDGLEMR